MRNYLLCFVALFLSFNAVAQNLSIKGNIIDTASNDKLRDAMILAVNLDDSVLLDFKRSDYNGEFVFENLPVTTIELIISHPRFEDKSLYVIGTPSKKEFVIPNIVLSTQNEMLDEVMIFADTDPVFFRGDTLVYLADSFKVGEHAVVEDLLKKLPGIDVDENGNIKSQGKEVAKVLVDGDEFFGSDPTIATKNLSADGVESVQVYEKKNEDAQDGDDETIQVLDVKLKEEAKKGYFGRVSGASDGGLTIQNNPFYEGELLLNKFNRTRKISVFGLGTNTPRSGFNWRDANKFGLDEEKGDFDWASNGMSGANGQMSGIPQTLKAGIYYSDKFGKKKNTKVNMNYAYYNNELDAQSSSLSQYFLSDSSYFTDNTAREFSKDESHRFNVRLESEIDSLTSVVIRPRVTIDAANKDNSSNATFVTEDMMDTTLVTDILNTSSSNGYSIINNAIFKRKFKKDKRELEVEYDLNLNDNSTESNLNSTTYYVDTISFTSEIKQQRTNVNSYQGHKGKLKYIEPLSKKIKVEFEYIYDHTFSDVSIESYNYDATNGEYTEFVSANSNIFTTLRQENKGGGKLIFDSKKHHVSLGSKWRNVAIVNDNKISGYSIIQNVNNLLPSFRYTYKPKRGTRVSSSYKTTSTLPSISAIQPVIDVSNPNRISEGNPDLLPNYQHQLSLSFNKWAALSGRYIWTSANYMYYQNAFANSTVYDEFGRTYSKTINVDGNQFANLYAGAGFPILNRKLEFSPNVNTSYNKYSNFINGEQNITENTTVAGGLKVSLRLDSLEISIGNNYTYNRPVSSLSVFSNKPFSTQVYTARLKWTLPHHFIIKSDVRYTINNQLSKAYNLNYFIWNAEIGRRFLETENLMLSIIGNDILNQNIIAQRQINGNVITDNRTKIISRYLLLKLTYKFNNNKTKEEDAKGWH